MPASNAIVTVDRFKSWHDLKTTTTADDAILEGLIDTASAEIESLCNRVLRKGTFVDEPYDGNDSRVLRLRRPPIWSIASVKLIDGATLLEVVDPATYVVPSLAADQNADPNDGR